MFTSWDKALVPFVLSLVGVLVYSGVLSEDQATVLEASVVPATVAFIQAVLVYFTPNR